MNLHEQYMQRCLQLAKLGMGTAAPNPMVGSVIVHQGRIIGEGYHERCGEAHAEVNAIRSVQNQDLLKESTLYVNLEPCAHVGRTPACSSLIIEKEIPRVVIGCTDSFEKVSGKGIQMLKDAGVDVVLGVLEQESLELNKRFFTFHNQKRPYIILKWAETKDGFIDYERSEENPQAAWITNDLCRALVHKWRTEEPAILVGTQTLIKDNPQLNVRAWTGRNPIRVSFDRFLEAPQTHYLFDDSQETFIFSEKKSLDKTSKQTHLIEIEPDKDLNTQILSFLHENEIQSLIVEGGQQVLDAFISQGLWDEARVFTGNVQFGKGVKAPKFCFKESTSEQIGDAVLKTYFKQI